MTIRLAGIGAGCAVFAALLVSISSPAVAQSKASPIALTPSAQQAPKARIAPKAAPVATVQRERKPNRMPHWNTYTMGNADLAFLSATQYLELTAYDGVIWMVAEHEFNLLDFAAGNVRVVDPDELSEIDLANDPQVVLARAPASDDAKPVYQVASAQPVADKGDDDDGILSRILMTFAGALAVAGAMKMLFA